MELLEVFGTFCNGQIKNAPFFSSTSLTNPYPWIDGFEGFLKIRAFLPYKILQSAPKKSCHLRDFWSYFFNKSSPVLQAHPTREGAASQAYAENIPDFY